MQDVNPHLIWDAPEKDLLKVEGFEKRKLLRGVLLKMLGVRHPVVLDLASSLPYRPFLCP